jgi:hypothetical protein
MFFVLFVSPPPLRAFFVPPRRHTVEETTWTGQEGGIRGDKQTEQKEAGRIDTKVIAHIKGL